MKEYNTYSRDEPYPYRVNWDHGEFSNLLQWLRDLPNVNESQCGWKLHGVLYFSFFREEDAVAFKLKFGG